LHGGQGGHGGHGLHGGHGGHGSHGGQAGLHGRQQRLGWQQRGGDNKQLPMHVSTFSPQQTPLPKPPTIQLTPLQISLIPLSQHGEQQRGEQHLEQHI